MKLLPVLTAALCCFTLHSHAQESVNTDAGFGPKGQDDLLLTAGENGRVVLWKVTADRPVAVPSFDHDGESVGFAAFGADGKSILSRLRKAERCASGKQARESCWNRFLGTQTAVRTE